MDSSELHSLVAFLTRIPAIDNGSIASGTYDDGLWWVKFQIDIGHTLAWHTVQELGCIANCISVSDRLPTAFYPVSPAPYLNGGPFEFLSWILETKNAEFTPSLMVEWLEGRMPNPVEDESVWQSDD